MNIPRKLLLSATVLVIVGTVVGIGVFTMMEHQARAALPPHEQTADAIQALYDGAVCLKCDYGRIFLGMFGFAAFISVLIIWAVYEVGRICLIRISTPK